MWLAGLIALSMLSLFAQHSPDAGSLLNNPSGNLRNYRSYQYEEEVTSETGVAGTPTSIKMTTLVQAVNPGKYKRQMKSGATGQFTMLNDGKYLWIFTQAQHQYTKQALGPNGIEGLTGADGQFAKAMARGGSVASMLAGVEQSAKVIRSEFVELDGLQRDCWVVESRPEKGANSLISDVVLSYWIDKTLLIPLRTATSMKMAAGQNGTSEIKTSMRIHSLKLDLQIPDSVFVFTPAADAVEVADFISGAEVKSAQAIAAPAPKPILEGAPEAFVPNKKPISRTKPVYPEEARKEKVQGFVQMLVTIDRQGLVIDAESLTGPKLLRQAALDAVRQWRFEPVIRHGMPVMALAEVIEHFFLPLEMLNARREEENMQDRWDASQRIRELTRRFPRSAELILEDVEREPIEAGGPFRLSALSERAKAALKAGALQKATAFAREMLASHDQNNYNGDMIHDGNMVLGLVAMREGNIAQAKTYLLESGRTSGSPVLGSFGPSMNLAKELLEKGEKDVVLEYFSLCKVFWKLHPETLDLWSAKVREGGMPDFSMNLR